MSDSSNQLPDWESIDLSALTLVVAWRTSTGTVTARRVATNQAVADDLRVVCRDNLARLRSLEVQSWTPEAAAEREEYLLAKHEQLGEDSAVISAITADNFDPISANELPATPILFYAIIVGHPNRRVAFLRKYNPQRAIGHRLVTFFTDRLEKLQQTLFIFDYQIDLVYDPDSGLSILSLGAFNLLFKTAPETLAKIAEDVEQVASVLPMTSDSMAFISARATTDSRVRRRLESIVARGHLQNVTIDVLREEIERQGLSPDTYIVDGKLDLSKGDVPEILKVLNEDLFVGGLSGAAFEVARKSPRSR